MRLGEAVSRVEENGEITAGRGKEVFDLVVVATGSKVEAKVPSAWRKKGLHVLADLDSFRSLRDSLPDYERVAVGGNGLLALDVSERMARLGVKVTLFAAGGPLADRISDALRPIVERGIGAAGVTLVKAGPDNLAGVERVEAVVAGGDIFPCRAYIAIPDWVPNVSGIDASAGRLGGILVDGGMKSSLDSVFAAGECAEVRVGSATHLVRPDSARVTGLVAGANASGGAAQARLVGPSSREIFGVDFADCGLTLNEARLAGFDVDEVSRSDAQSACALVFERTSLRVVGAQAAGASVRELSQPLALAVLGSLRLDDLAYSDFASSDISLVSETAREGLKSR